MIEFSLLKEMPKKLAQMQAELENPKKDKAGMHKAKYAQLDTVIDVIKPIATKYGFSVVQFPYNDNDVFGVETLLIHESGEYIRGRYGSKITSTNPQDYGKMITYYRRYALGALFNIAPEDDDDADSVASSAKPSDKQLNAMYYKVKDHAPNSMLIFNEVVKPNINLTTYKWLMDNFNQANFDKVATKLRG